MEYLDEHPGVGMVSSHQPIKSAVESFNRVVGSEVLAVAVPHCKWNGWVLQPLLSVVREKVSQIITYIVLSNLLEEVKCVHNFCFWQERQCHKLAAGSLNERMFLVWYRKAQELYLTPYSLCKMEEAAMKACCC